MTITKSLSVYIDYRNLTPMQRLDIYKFVKSNNPKVKSLAKIERLCVEYFKNNIHGKN